MLDLCWLAEVVIYNQEQNIQILNMLEGKRKHWSELSLIMTILALPEVLEGLAYRILLDKGYVIIIDIEGRRARYYHSGIKGHIKGTCEILKKRNSHLCGECVSVYVDYITIIASHEDQLPWAGDCIVGYKMMVGEG